MVSRQVQLSLVSKGRHQKRERGREKNRKEERKNCFTVSNCNWRDHVTICWIIWPLVVENVTPICQLMSFGVNLWQCEKPYTYESGWEDVSVHNQAEKISVFHCGWKSTGFAKLYLSHVSLSLLLIMVLDFAVFVKSDALSFFKQYLKSNPSSQKRVLWGKQITVHCWCIKLWKVRGILVGTTYTGFPFYFPELGGDRLLFLSFVTRNNFLFPCVANSNQLHTQAMCFNGRNYAIKGDIETLSCSNSVRGSFNHLGTYHVKTCERREFSSWQIQN